MPIAALPPPFTPFLSFGVGIGETPEDWYIHSTAVTVCVFLQCVCKQHPCHSYTRCCCSQMLELYCCSCKRFGGLVVGISYPLPQAWYGGDIFGCSLPSVAQRDPSVLSHVWMALCCAPPPPSVTQCCSELEATFGTDLKSNDRIPVSRG